MVAEDHDTLPSGGRFPSWVPRWVAIALGLGIFGTLIWVLRFDRARIASCMGELHWTVVAAVPVCTAVTLSGRFLRWHFLLRRIDVRLRTRTSLAIYAFSLPMVLTPAYIGELVRAELVHRAVGRSRARAACVVVFERLLDFLALTIIWIGATLHVVPFIGVVAAIALSIALADRWARRRAPHARRANDGQGDEPGSSFGAGMGERPLRANAFRRLLDPRAVGVALFASVLIWLPPCAGLFLLVRGAGFPIHAADAAATFSGGTVLSALTLSPAGVGVAGSLMVRNLTELRDVAGSTMAAETAIAVVIVLRLATTWLSVAIGGISLMAYGRGWRWWRSARDTTKHFEALSETYDTEIPEHVRRYLLRKKTRLMIDQLGAGRLCGLDIGCGRGWHAEAMQSAGHTIVAMDVSFAQASAARGLLGIDDGWGAVVASGDLLPFADGAFDYAYAINVVHHLPDQPTQRKLFADVARVLRPGGRFFLHEINITNPLFRLYMSYFFPIIRNIDEGDEHWLLPARLESTDALELASIDYFTFFPDFLPRILLGPLRPLDERLATSPFRRYSAHYMATFVRRVAE